MTKRETKVVGHAERERGVRREGGREGGRQRERERGRRERVIYWNYSPSPTMPSTSNLFITSPRSGHFLKADDWRWSLAGLRMVSPYWMRGA